MTTLSKTENKLSVGFDFDDFKQWNVDVLNFPKDANSRRLIVYALLQNDFTESFISNNIFDVSVKADVEGIRMLAEIKIITKEYCYSFHNLNDLVNLFKNLPNIAESSVYYYQNKYFLFVECGGNLNLHMSEYGTSEYYNEFTKIFFAEYGKEICAKNAIEILRRTLA